MKALAILLLPLSLAGLWHRATQETNSHSANGRGVKAFAARQYAKAAEAFGVANTSKPSAAHAFNLGTAEIAAGKSEEGAAALAMAMRDGALRENALYNRGNGALTANAFDSAIRDYREALRLTPGDAQAKRNLEIALLRKQQQQQSRSGQQKSQTGPQSNPQRPQPSPGAGKNDQRGGDQSAESLLRAVQQQEQEELNRMKRAHAQRGRVGW
jgi:Flp pilus assembly protein TadD